MTFSPFLRFAVRRASVSAMTVLGVGSLLCPAHAQLTHSISFDDTSYPDFFDINALGGSDLGFGTNLWFDGAAPGTGTTIASGSLIGPAQLPTTGNRAATPAADFNLAFYTFDLDNDQANGEPEDALAPGEHWLSFLAKADPNAGFGGFSFTKFFGDEILYIGKVGGAGSAEWGIDQGTSGPVGVTGSDSSQDTLLVAKITIGASGNDDTIDLFVNPAIGGSVPTTPDIAGYVFNEDPAALNGDGNRIRQIDEIRLGSQNGSFEFDEFRLGATFFDVTIPGGATIVGDYNGDGFVSQPDLDLVLLNWGDSVLPSGFDPAALPGGASFDDLVSQNELDGVLLNWGNGTPPSSVSAIPEPTSLVLLSLAGGLMLQRRRKTC